MSIRDQHDALADVGCEQIVIDRASGKVAQRAELDKALLSATPNRGGDQLVIATLDRLSRCLEHVVDRSHRRQDHSVDLVVLDEEIDAATAGGGLFLSILVSMVKSLQLTQCDSGSRSRNPGDGQSLGMSARVGFWRCGPTPLMRCAVH